MIDRLYSTGNTILKFSDYEIEYLTNINHKVEENDALLSYLKGFETSNIQQFQSLKVTANIATQPNRYQFLLEMLKSIEGQFDEIRIYLNNFRYVPDELRKYTTYIGKDLTDNGKFFWSENDNEFYFTLDDDIIYPPDYVKKTLPLINDRIVTYHGRNLYGLNQPYYNNHKVYSFYNSLKKEVKLDIGGTGVMAFNTNEFKPNLWKSPNTKMTDLLISLEASLFNKEIVCLPKESQWIKPIEYLNDGIYTEYLGRDTKQTIFADLILTHKNQNTKLDRRFLGIQLNKSSIENISEQIKLNINSDIKYFFHLGCVDGTSLFHFINLLELEYYVGVETTDERITVCNLLSKSLKYEFPDLGSKFVFFNESYDNIRIPENTVVLLNDYAMSDEHSINLWNNLPNGVHLITTKYLDHNPVCKLKCASRNEIEMQYFYYIKETELTNHVDYCYDKTIIINLDNCVESSNRYKLLQQRLYHFNKPERFNAFRGRTEEYINFVTDEWNRKLFDSNLEERYVRMSDGEIGCALSHSKVWQKIVDDNLQNCLVLEDDALKILPGFEYIVSDLMKKLPDDWDIFLLGFKTLKDTCQQINDDIYKVKDFVLFHSYIINKKGAKKLLDNLPVNAPVDTFVSSISDKVNIYRHNMTRKKESKKRKTSYLISQHNSGSFIKHTNIEDKNISLKDFFKSN